MRRAPDFHDAVPPRHRPLPVGIAVVAAAAVRAVIAESPVPAEAAGPLRGAGIAMVSAAVTAAPGGFAELAAQAEETIHLHR